MDVDDSAVDLSVRSLPPELSELRALTASGLTITPAQPPPHGASGKRVLRPRSEQRSYAESPDIVLLPAAPPHRKPSLPAPAPFTDVSSKLNTSGVNVSITASAVPMLPPESPRDPQDEEDSDDENEPPLPIAGHRELSSAEIWERERRLRALREKLRAEETRLVLLRKLRQSQNAALLPPAKVVLLPKGVVMLSPLGFPVFKLSNHRTNLTDIDIRDFIRKNATTVVHVDLRYPDS
ncbi:unnamed protein product [Euphydryas editha]|uniref:Transcriptional repressor p66 coiled-coil MBD2-interaction domain-containing protein n=1 Tax=Euphydryas editha TaxID=104508 RepID=A0AAU9UKW0_EUPED|nr:unnamed protein product [Euphydryas editha]